MSQTSDETIEMFMKHWESREPAFHLDNAEVREQIAILLSAAMSLLAIAPPEVWNGFMKECASAANALVPVDVKNQIKGAVS